MSLEDLKIEYEKMQQAYGDKTLKSIHFGGCDKNPDICFVFMNPTARNNASDPSWKGLRAPWIGTKNIWDLFIATNLFDIDLYHKIKNKKASEWDEEFAEKVYNEVKKNKIFITNLGKCTQLDARPIPNEVYKQYLNLLEKEIETGIDIPQQCLNEYNQIRKEHNIENDSIEVWEEAMKNVFTKFTM